jgi:hypothetical protein
LGNRRKPLIEGENRIASVPHPEDGRKKLISCGHI